jgi:DNA-binding response OmpR family regulator
LPWPGGLPPVAARGALSARATRSRLPPGWGRTSNARPSPCTIPSWPHGSRASSRREGRSEGPCRIGELAINPATREVRVGARPIELAAKEFALLRALAADPRRVLTKEELLRDVWGYRSLGRTRTLDSHASRLRRKLDPEHSRFVHNCWGVGYRLIEG